MAPKTLPSRELLHQLLSYDAETGVLTWLPRPREMFSNEHYFRLWNTRYAGSAAGSVNGVGYLAISLDYKRYTAHRLIWAYVYGDPVPAMIDHEDHNRLNNRIDNLRSATDAQNIANSTVRKNSVLGVKGVITHGRGFKAQIKCKGRNNYLGTFDTLEEAANAYREAAIRLHGAFARWD